MNSCGWNILFLEEFISPTETYIAYLEKRLSASPSEKEAEQLLRHGSELAAYVASTARIRNGERDPGNLPPAVEPNGIPIANFYMLKVGPWRGYYRLDHAAKTGVGVLTLHEGHDLQDTLQKVLQDAIGRAGRPE